MPFTEQTFAFYDGLVADNSRTWWLAHKADYDQHVKGPMDDLVAALADEFGEAKMFRPNRDVRFSKDKSPYKTHQGAWVQVRPAMGWYVEVSSEGLRTGAGFYHAEPDALRRFRAAVAADGGVLQRILDDLPRAMHVHGETLVRTPKGFDADDPHADLLRHKTLSAMRLYGRRLPKDVTAAVRRDWRAVTPLLDWLDGAMGDAFPAARD